MHRPPGALTPASFVEKWSRSDLSERAASHEHFLDLCNLLDQPTPGMADPTGSDYTFEKPVKVVGTASKGSKGESGFVDVWKRGCFAWEYKRKDKYKSLDEAYRQLYQYRDDLDNPPLSIVCDIRTTEIRTHFPGFPTHKVTLKLEELPGRLDVLRRCFVSPETFRPEKTTDAITQDLAEEFSELANRLIERFPPADLSLWEYAGSPVAHFLMKVMFCLFAEDIELLPDNAFTKLIDRATYDADSFVPRADLLWKLMRTGGEFGNDLIEWFNGGLFDDAPPIPLLYGDLLVLKRLADRRWSDVEPSIFGTLFERILDPRKRAQIGAHYTSKSDILLVIEPVIMTPLRRKWQAVQDELKTALATHEAEPDRKKRDVLAAPIKVALDQFRRHLGSQRVLDPACGSGNFLYVALQQLLDLDDEVVRFAARRDIALSPVPYVRPTQMHGIEINPYAAELAQVVIWIGYLQWLHVHGIDNPKRPILDKLQTIENRDAILDLKDKDNPKPADWPEADFIAGNPPFLGTKMLRAGLGDEYVRKLFEVYSERIPGFSDLCCYWFELGRQRVQLSRGTRVGLLATQAIRNGVARRVLERILATGTIFMAWADRQWMQDGAAVQISIVGFDGGLEAERVLNGRKVDGIHANLTAGENVTAAVSLQENRDIAFVGDVKGGPFDVSLDTARDLFQNPPPNSKPLFKVIRPYVNGLDVTRRDRSVWVIDFGRDATKGEAAGYGASFEHVAKVVKPMRDSGRPSRSEWWLHMRPCPSMRDAVEALPRYVATPTLTKYRLFVWMSGNALPDHQLAVFARTDDYFLGILQSALHELWALRTGTQLREIESGFRYTPTTCFETFPLPWPPGKEDVKHPAYQRISAAARELNEKRERWLNPPEWIEPLAQRIDATDDFSDVPPEARPLIRQSAIMAAAAKDARLKKRTLTNLYNERPTWLSLAHEQLDRGVLAAYAAVDPRGGWSEDWAEVWTETGAGRPLPLEHASRARRADVDARILAALLELNRKRAGAATQTSVQIQTLDKHRPLADEKTLGAVADFRKGLEAIYGNRLARVVLFGSRARGTASAGSDADLLVVLAGPLNQSVELERTSALVTKLSLLHGVTLSRIFMNKAMADSSEGLLQANIRRDGIVI